MKKEKSCGCIVLKDDKVLLVGGRDDKGIMYWSFPKGHQEKGETDFETARRETKEEVGIDARIVDESPIATWYLVHNGTVRKDVLLFIAEPINTEIKRQEDEVEYAEWVQINEAGKRFDNYYGDVWAELLGRLNK